jgi:branched-chain amino acid transport system ATP-binding protein
MVAVSRALMFATKLLMLDEPSQSLAPKIVGEMYEKLKEIHSKGTTILLVEQNITSALRYSGRSYVFENGRVSLEGNSEELKENEEIRRAYLGV